MGDIKDRAPPLARATNHREQQQNNPKHADLNEDYRDSEEDDQGLSTHVCEKNTQAERPVLTNNGQSLPQITLGLGHAQWTKL